MKIISSKRLFFTTLTLVATLTGCQTTEFVKEVIPSPSTNKYKFIENDGEFRRHTPEIYADEYARAGNEGYLFDALISQPSGHSICFSEQNYAWALGEKNQKSTNFTSGVYPFSIYKTVKMSDGTHQTDCDSLQNKLYTGAMVFYNYDSEMELTSFGLSDESKLFKSELLTKVDEGVLGNNTVKFDGKPRITYWIGNRTSSFTGGNPTVELDFSKANLAEVHVNGEPIENMSSVVPVFEEIENDYGGWDSVALDHKIYMKSLDGREYTGYIRKLVNNEYTAFMSVPFDIPNKLYDAAARGTVSKYQIKAKGDDGQETAIAEIVFGAKR